MSDADDRVEVERKAEAAFATLATKRCLSRAIMSDMRGWIIPLLPVTILGLTQIASAGWFVTVCTIALSLSLINVVHDGRALKRFGYTTGMQKYHLRVIDPELDAIVYKARLFPKKISKFLTGQYEVLDLSESREQL